MLKDRLKKVRIKERLNKVRIKELKIDHAKIRKLFAFSLIGLIIFAIVSLLLELGLDFSSIYGVAKSPITFSILNFIGHIFFVPLPGEEIMFFYFLSTGLSPAFVILLAVSTALAAQTIDYFIGRLVSENVIQKFIKKEKYAIAENYVKRYGAPTIFLFNILPLSSPIILLAAGMLRYDFKKATFWSIAGLTAKYAAIAGAYLFLI